jgi:magnesium transporter
MLKTLVWEGYQRDAAGQTQHNGHFRELEDPTQISDLLATKQNLLWLDLTAPTQEELQLIAEEFALHPLAVEDAAKGNQRPKIDEYDDFYFMVVFAIKSITPPEDDDTGTAISTSRIETHEIDLFISERFLITVHATPLPFVEDLLERWRHNSRAIDEGIGVLVYTILDGIVDAYFPVLDDIVEQVEALEEKLFTNVVRRGKTYDMRSLFQIKRDLLQLRRVMAPERDALLVLARQEVPLFGRNVTVYFQDVYDHVVRVTDAIDVYQDLLTNALESYLSLVSNNLNQVMKTLTSLTVILMVPTLIAGIYGMNFDNMPELHWGVGYPLALAMMVGAALALFTLFRRKHWI